MTKAELVEVCAVGGALGLLIQALTNVKEMCGDVQTEAGQHYAGTIRAIVRPTFEALDRICDIIINESRKEVLKG